jgi:hypothetical protein
MADRALKLKELRRILRKFPGITEDPSGGKGSHTLFERNIGNDTFTYPIPTTGSDVLICYVRGIRKKFKLRRADGVSDKQFYA